MALEVEDLRKSFRGGAGLFVSGPSSMAVDGVSFMVREGTTMGLIGESGSGKSTTARMICRLIAPDSGRVYVGGKDTSELGRRESRAMCQDIQIVFQDPGSSLNPRWTVGSLVEEGIRTHGAASHRGLRRRVGEILEMCGISPATAGRYPHEFSGGQRQRIALARALAVEPKILVLDEPVSALDVSVQAQILLLLRELQSHFGLTYLMVSHDLAVVESFCDDVCVMRKGRIVESGGAADICNNPLESYTKELVDAHPIPDPRRRRTSRVTERNRGK